jgi:hypothetical protein
MKISSSEDCFEEIWEEENEMEEEENVDWMRRILSNPVGFDV